MKTIIIASCLLVAGCTSTVSQTEQQYYDVYDEQGKRKGYISKVSESVIFSQFSCQLLEFWIIGKDFSLSTHPLNPSQ
ncbi:hypothetical protein, partial [Candidatus Kuenenia stuttgartiensis]|uniref:hypothetical protein n=1 Tax=Kuenenia stuttgartiensis TaxID=174633 RepID=UPI00146A23DB